MFIFQTICIYFMSIFSLIMPWTRQLILSFWMAVVRPHMLSALSTSRLERDEKTEQEQNTIRNTTLYPSELFLYGSSPNCQTSGSSASMAWLWILFFPLIYHSKSDGKAASKELSISPWGQSKRTSILYCAFWLRDTEIRKGHIELIRLTE